jgi:hypothetical protein
MADGERYTVRLLDEETVKTIRILAATYGMIQADVITWAVIHLREDLADGKAHFNRDKELVTYIDAKGRRV